MEPFQLNVHLVAHPVGNRGVTHQPILMERGNQMTDKTQASLLLRILEKAQQEKPRGLRKQWYPPASQEQVQATEEALGFALPRDAQRGYLTEQ